MKAVVLGALLFSSLQIGCGDVETATAYAISADAVAAPSTEDVTGAGTVLAPGHIVKVALDGSVSLVEGGLAFDVRTRSVLDTLTPEIPAQSPGVAGETWVDRGVAIERIVTVEEGVSQSWLFLDRPAGAEDLVIRVHVPSGEHAGSLGGAHLFVEGNRTFQYGRATWIDDDARRFEVDSTWDEPAREIVLRVSAEALAASTFPAVLDPIIGAELDIDVGLNGPVGFQETQPAVARGASTWLTVWTDTRNGNSDIYGARVDDDGNVLDPLGIKIAGAAFDQDDPRVARAPGGFVVAWTDRRVDGVSGDIFGAFVSDAGTVAQAGGQPVSFAIAATVADERTPDVVGDGAIAPIVVWDSGGDIRGASVTGDGVVTPFAAIEGSAAVQARPAVAMDPAIAGNVLVAWHEVLASGDIEVRARRITKAGARVDNGATPIIVSNGAGARTSPRVAWAGSSFVVAYQMQFQSYDVRVSRVSAAGVDLDVVDATVTTLAARHYAPSVACIGGQCVIAWQSGDGFEWNVLAAAFDASTMAVAPAVTVSGHDRREHGVSIAASATAFFAAWQDERSGNGSDIFAARIGSLAAIVDPTGILLSRGNNRMQRPVVGAASAGFVSVWMDSNAAAKGRLRGRRLDLNGLPSSTVGLYVGRKLTGSVQLLNTTGKVLVDENVGSSVIACGVVVAGGTNGATDAGAPCGANTPLNALAHQTIPAPTSPPNGWRAEDSFFYDWESPCNFYSRSGTGFFFWDPTANGGTCGAYVGRLVPPTTDPATPGGCWVPIFLSKNGPKVYTPYRISGVSDAEVTPLLSASEPSGCRSWEPKAGASTPGAIVDPGGGGGGNTNNWYGGGVVTRTKPDWSQCGGPSFPASRVRWGATPPDPVAVGPDETCGPECDGTTKVLDWCPSLGKKHLDFAFDSVNARRAVPTGTFYVDGDYENKDPFGCAPDDQTNPAPNGTTWPMMTLIVKDDYDQPNDGDVCWGVGTKKALYASLVVGHDFKRSAGTSTFRAAGSVFVGNNLQIKQVATVFGAIRVDHDFVQDSAGAFTWRYTRDIANVAGGGGGGAGVDFAAFTLGGAQAGGAVTPAISKRATSAGDTFLVTWSDTRADVWGDIYGARVGFAAAVIDVVGFPIAATAGVQELAPAVATDGTDWLVVWQDRGAGFNIHGAIVRADGTLDARDIDISSAANDQLVPTVAWDPAAGVYLVAWMDLRSGSADIFASRVSSSGVVLDPSGVAISVAAGLQEHPDAAAGSGVVALAWADERGASRDIFAARLRLTSGAIELLDANGIGVSTAAALQRLPSIDSNGIDFGVVWSDFRNGSDDVFAARLSGVTGAVVPSNGTAVATNSALDESNPAFSAAANAALRGVLLYSRREQALETERAKAKTMNFD